MDVALLAQAIVSLLTPVLPLLVKLGEKGVEEIGKKMGESTWEFAKKIWKKLSPKLSANPITKEAVVDVSKNPKDEDAIASLRLQIRKILTENISLAQELYLQLGDIQSAARNINVNGSVYGSTFVTGNENVFQNGQYNYNVKIGKAEKIIFGKENRITEVKEIELDFWQPTSGKYPTQYWYDKSSFVDIMFRQNSKIVNEHWDPEGINLQTLRSFLVKEVNRWTMQGWELISDIKDPFIFNSDSAETTGSALGGILGLPTGITWKHWRVFHGARFHIRKFLD